MLSVRLPETMERDLNQYCAIRKLSKSQVVQEALAEYLVANGMAVREIQRPLIDTHKVERAVAAQQAAETR